MARYNRRRYPSYRRQEKNYSWFPVDFNKAQSWASGKNYLIATSDAHDFDTVCERQRGLITWIPSSGSAQVESGILYSVVLPSIIVNTPTPGDELPDNFPNPADPNGTDDFALWHPFSTNNQYSLAFDSKARRKVGKDELLYLGLRIDRGLTASLSLGVLGRCLFSWKI